jgi:hypothetical protein
MPTLPRTNGENRMIPTVEANGGVILGDQNCSTCKLIFPLCGKKKAVHVGFCRHPFVLETHGENHLPFNDNQETRSEK